MQTLATVFTIQFGITIFAILCHNSLFCKQIVHSLQKFSFTLITGIQSPQNDNAAPLHTVKLQKFHSFAHNVVSFSIIQFQSLQSHKLAKTLFTDTLLLL